MWPTYEEWSAALENRHGKEVQKRFSSATVAVCGLGGLGSNIAISLARAGIGKLILIDFDKVDITNIHRQQYKVSQIGLNKTDALKANITEISPYIQTETVTQKMTEENIVRILKNANIVCEAFDQAEEKAMLVNNVLAYLPEVYLVAASGMAGMESANSIHTRKVLKRFYLCGDEKSDVNDTNGLVASRVMVCAAHQAHMVLRILAGEYEV